MAAALQSRQFSRRGPELVLRLPDVEHVVSVHAVRRLAGYCGMEHTICQVIENPAQATGRPPLIQEQIRGFLDPYHGLWASDRFDIALAVQQVDAMVKSFSSLADVAHFYSDRPLPQHLSALPAHRVSATPRSLSRAEEWDHSNHHARAIFSDSFAKAPRLGQEMWVHHQEVGGFRWCVYLASVFTATCATVMYFPFSTTNIEKGRKNAQVMRMLMATPKRLLMHDGKPLLVSLAGAAVDHSWIADVLRAALSERPANAIG